MEALGDYVSGTNRFLPTMKTARYFGRVWGRNLPKGC